MKTVVGTDMGCRYGMDLVEKRRAKREAHDICQTRLDEEIETLDTGEVKELFVSMGDESDKAERITDALAACSACKGNPEQAAIPDGVCPMARMIVSKSFE